jgi:regulation of enolase protein 1 (concanavalin A-like superfamily)
MFDHCRWLNEPRRWGLHPAGLTVVTDQGTDFWRETHYGFTHHSGHVFARDTDGAFTATVRVRSRFEALYDQAGLMVLVDHENWVKAGIELSDGEALLGSVLTLGRSDWAVGKFWADPADFWIRATVEAGVLRLQASSDGQRWPLIRLCPFPDAARCLVGPMCCTPERAGLEVLFSDFSVAPPSGKALHDLS